ncbi:MAG: hypothetical protein M1383_03320 [Patescibacteria group bacterium]|nr:hypothetical protein [Patescibacteria group bacterium]
MSYEYYRPPENERPPSQYWVKFADQRSAYLAKQALKHHEGNKAIYEDPKPGNGKLASVYDDLESYGNDPGLNYQGDPLGVEINYKPRLERDMRDELWDFFAEKIRITPTGIYTKFSDKPYVREGAQKPKPKVVPFRPEAQPSPPERQEQELPDQKLPKEKAG